MSLFIHLNGPPGIGKSTLAELYVADHPGVLNLDIDQVRGMIGGWQERFAETGEIVRPMAKVMALTHLRGGRDVVMPQYLGVVGELAGFEAVADEAGATFCEVVLMDDKERSLLRFSGRGAGDERPWHRQVREIVRRQGGRDMLAAMYDRLADVIAARPSAVVVPSAEGEVEQTYRSLVSVLERDG
jgi:hypothetical protein